MKKLTKKQIALIVWAVIITAMCAYAFYYFIWGINQNCKTIQGAKNSLTTWKNATPNEDRTSEFIAEQIEINELIIETAVELNTKLIISTIFVFSAYTSFIILIALNIFKRHNIPVPPVEL